MPPPDRLEVGRITKPHGLRGEVVVILTTNRTERLDVGAVLYTDAEPDGRLTVAAARPHGSRHLVRFEEMAARTAVEPLRGAVLMADPLDDPDELCSWYAATELMGPPACKLKLRADVPAL